MARAAAAGAKLLRLDYHRVHIRGVSGSGKSTLGVRLARALGAEYVSLDRLWHRDNWQEAPADEFRKLVADAVSADRWVVDGNYSKVQEIVLPRAELVVWLDYALPVVLWRLTRRTLRDWYRKEPLWGTNNRESLVRHFLIPHHSLYVWVFRRYWKIRREMLGWNDGMGFANVEVLRFRRPFETEKWVSQIESSNNRMSATR